MSVITNINKLKPCPFCGTEVFLDRWTKNGLEIKCSKCFAMMRQKVLRFDLKWLDAQLTDAWNQRQQDKKDEV